MKINKILKTLIIIFSSSAILICVLIILFFNFGLPIADSEAKAISAIKTEIAPFEKENIFSTTSLKIPSLKIDTVLERVSLTSAGAVGAPKNILKAAWFDGSVKPGLIGDSVIVGHFGWKWGVQSIFNNLSKLQKGDIIYIDDGSDKPITFIVQKVQKYNKDSKVPEIFISDDNKAHLNLITCNGVWNKISKNYSERLVIFTDRK